MDNNARDKNDEPKIIADPITVRLRLTDFLSSGVLGSAMARDVGRLLKAFENEETVPLHSLLQCLYPKMKISGAQNAFRVFKLRFNELAEKHGVQLEFASSAGTGLAQTKSAWFHDTNIKEAEIRKGVQDARTVSAITHKTDQFDPDQFIPIAIGTEAIPCPTFPKDVNALCRMHFRDAWDGLDESGRDFLRQLGAKFEPIRRLAPPPPGKYETVGFEVLAFDAAGRSFAEIDEFASKTLRLPAAMHRIVLLFAGLRTIQLLCITVPLHAPSVRMDRFLFTMNLDPPMLEHPALGDLAEYFRFLFPNRFVFEVNEKFPPNQVGPLLKFRAAFGFQLALDDIDDMHAKTRRALAPFACMTKVGYKKTRLLLDTFAARPQAALKELSKFKRKGIPLTVEALEEDLGQTFFARQWDESWGELYAQGRGLEADPVLEPFLISLKKDFGVADAGFIVRPEQTDTLERALSLADYPTLPSLHQSEIKTEANLTTIVFEDLKRGIKYTAGILHKHSGDGSLCEALPPRIPDQVSLFAENPDFYRSRKKFQKWGNVRHLKELPDCLRSWALTPDYSEQVLEDSFAQRGTKFQRYDRDGYIDSEIDNAGPVELELAPDDAANRVSIENGLEFLLRWAGAAPAGKAAALSANTCALLGDFGSGKTYLCRRFTAALLERIKNDPNAPAPFYIDLRHVQTEIQDAARRNETPTLARIVEWIRDKFTYQQISPSGVLAAVEDGKVILILDGYDEIVMHLPTGGAERLMAEFRTAVKPNGKGRMLISCRTHYFVERPDEKRKLLGGPVSRTREGFQGEHLIIAYMRPFDRKRILEFLANRLGEQEGKRALGVIETIHDLSDLSKRPYLLEMIVYCLKEFEKLVGSGLVVDSDVYEVITREWLERDQKKHHLREDLKMRFMERLAFGFLEGGKPQIHYQKLIEWFAVELARIFPSAKTAEEVQILEGDLRTASFLSRDESGYYRFAHTSFLDFFAGRGLARGLSDGEANALDLPPVKREVLHFAASILRRPPFEAEKAAETVQTILETAYRPRVSENALRFVKAWREKGGTPAIEPAAWRLEGAQLQGESLAGMDLRGATFSGADLSFSDLDGAILSNADLFGANLLRASLHRAALREVNLENANLDMVRMDDADLTDANLPDARLQGARLLRATLDGACFRGARVQSASFLGARFAPADGPPLDAADCLIPEEMAAAIREVWEKAGSRPIGAAAGAALKVFLQPAGPFNCVAFSPDGSRLASASHDHTVRVWDPHAAKQIAVLKGHKESVRSIAFSPDGFLLASASSDHTVRIWDPYTAQTISVLKGHEDRVYSVTFSPDGSRLASASYDRTVRIWDVGAANKPIAVLKGHENPVLSVAFSPDGSRIASASEDRTIRIWDSITTKLITILKGHRKWVWSVAFSHNGLCLASASADQTVRIWGAHIAKQIAVLKGHENGVLSVAFSPDDSRLVSSSVDKTIRIWDARAAKQIAVLKGHEHWVRSVAFSPDGSRLASASLDRTVRIWDARAAKQLAVLKGHENWVLSVAFSPDGSRLASASNDHTVRIWDPRAAKQLAVLKGHENRVGSVAFSPDGSRLASASDDHTVRIWDPRAAKQLAVLKGHEDSVCSVAFSPDGSRLASASLDRTVRIWDPRAAKQLAVLKGHENWVLSVAFSPDGSRLASASHDQTVRIWDPRAAKQLALLKGHENPVWSVAFSPDGKRLVSSDRAGAVKVWDLDAEKELKTVYHLQGGLWAAEDEKGIITGPEAAFPFLRFLDEKKQIALDGEEMRTAAPERFRVAEE